MSILKTMTWVNWVVLVPETCFWQKEQTLVGISVQLESDGYTVNTDKNDAFHFSCFSRRHVGRPRKLPGDMFCKQERREALASKDLCLVPQYTFYLSNKFKEGVNGSRIGRPNLCENWNVSCVINLPTRCSFYIRARSPAHLLLISAMFCMQP